MTPATILLVLFRSRDADSQESTPASYEPGEGDWKPGEGDFSYGEGGGLEEN